MGINGFRVALVVHGSALFQRDRPKRMICMGIRVMDVVMRMIVLVTIAVAVSMRLVGV